VDRPLRILHVDDYEPNLYARGEALRRHGYEVVHARTGAEALERAARDLPAIVLADVSLPDISGVEVCRRLKRPQGPDVPLVINISAVAVESHARADALRAGADGYLVEPLTAEELIASIGAFERLWRAQQQLRQMADTLRRQQGELVQRVQQAEQAEATLQALLEFVPEGITIADAPDVTIRHVSRFGRELTGRSADDLEGSPASEHPARWGLFQQDGRTPAAPEELPLTRATCRGELVVDEEWILRRPDGEQLVLLCNAGPIKSADGSITGGIIAWRDISERRRLREQERQARNVAEAATRAKDHLLTVVAHELRQPLATIAAALGVIRQRTPDVDQRATQILDRQVLHLTRLVDDLLDASRMDRGTLAIAVQPVDLRDVLQRTVEVAAPWFEAKGQDLDVSLPDEPLRLVGDPERLGQVFNNLLHNASKFTPASGRAWLRAVSSDEGILVSVRDSGVGIEPDLLPRVFDLFVRASERAAGLGVGLTVVKGLVDLHHGRIEARSDGPGSGSEFVVALPALQPPGARVVTS
jgi:PAS domain S-box-containing protein